MFSNFCNVPDISDQSNDNQQTLLSTMITEIMFITLWPLLLVQNWGLCANILLNSEGYVIYYFTLIPFEITCPFSLHSTKSCAVVVTNTCISFGTAIVIQSLMMSPFKSYCRTQPKHVYFNISPLNINN